MSKRRIFAGVIILLSLNFIGAQETQKSPEDDFESFRKKQLQNFKKYTEQSNEEYRKYVEELKKEFEEYIKAYKAEYDSFLNEISKIWSDPELAEPQKWVEYSENFEIKKVIDYEKGEMRIELISESPPSREEYSSLLYQTLTESKEKAFKNDRLASNEEHKLKKHVKHLKTSKLDRTPAFQDLFFEKKKVTSSDIKEAVNNLLKKAHYYENPAKIRNKKVYGIKISLPPKHLQRKIERYRLIVNKYSKKYNISPSVIYAVIHTESAFNPLACSPVPAYGLMQIVPSTAGKDATKLIYGKPVLLSPSFLYNEENNIQVGGAYLFLLYYNVFKDVKDPESRLYCVIAAYNTGPGNVARAFTKTTNLKKAIKVINKLSPSEVFEALIRKLPYKETQEYVRKVLKRIPMYKNWEKQNMSDKKS